MKVITLSNQKGGVGKSTIAVHIAFYLNLKGKRVLFIDLDGQANSSTTLDKFKHESVTAVGLFNQNIKPEQYQQPILLIPGSLELSQIDRLDSSKAVKHFLANIKSGFSGFDYCVIDTAPSINLRLIAALTSCDYVLSPIELAGYSISGIKRTLQTVHGVKSKYNKKLSFLGMLPNRVNTRSNSHKKAVRDILKSYPGYVLNTFITNRTPISDAIDAKIAVWDSKNGNAKAAGREMMKVLDLVYSKMGGAE